jgi:hypothetical protein
VARWLGAALVTGVLTVLALLGVAGQYPGEGPEVLQLSSTHGVHLGDLAVAAAWLLGVGLVLGLARDPRTPGGAGPDPRHR